MRDFEDSTLWRVSAFERVREHTGTSGFARLGGPTLLPTTLLADLRRLHRDPQSDDVLEVVAACMRHREAALLCLQLDQLVWPVTLFPQPLLFHSPRDLAEASDAGFAALTLLTAEPPGVRPPGHWMHERVAHAEHYRPLPPLLWELAMRGPRRTLLAEIGGRAAYRLMPSRLGAARLPASGALGPAMQRLQRASVSLRDMAGWPGMDVERASRLLNALYLTGSLLITRSHPAAREQPGLLRSLFGSKPRN
jgi:hypothetical protein